MQEKFQATFDVFMVDSDAGIFLRDGRRLSLAPKEVATLCLLLRRPGVVIGKEELLNTVWHDHSVSDSSLMRCVSGIKKCLKQASPGAEDLIQSDYGRGYRFVGVLQSSQSFINDEAFYALIDVSPDFVALKDGESRWLAVNKTGLRLYDLEGREWQGKTDLELADMVPHFREGFEACIASDEEAWKAGETTYSMEKVTSDSGERTFHVAKSPIFAADGKRKTLVVFGRDVTALIWV